MWRRFVKTRAGKVVTLYIVFMLVLAVYDRLAHILPPHPSVPEGCRVVVYDIEGVVGDVEMEGVCVEKGMSVEEFRELGNLPVDAVVIVGHGFVRGGEFVLETSEKVDWLTGFRHLGTWYRLYRGVLEGRDVVAVRAGIPMAELGGKTVVLITCGLDGVDRFAEELVRRGASLVVYYNQPSLDPEAARALALQVLQTIRNPSMLCVHSTLTCLGGG